MSQLMKKRFPSITSIDVGSDGNTSFLRAARNGQLDKVLEHLKTNIDINTSNANGLNALHLASKDGHVAIVSELLKRGAAVDAATKKGNTALHIASLAGQEEVVRLLVAHGASVNVQSQNGFTPLYMAAQENHDRVVRFLLASGANQALSTEDGFTPLAVAMQQGHEKVVTVLLENDSRGKVRLPALHIAAKKDDVKAAKLLLENDHNPDVTSKSGFTPLHIASHYGNQAIANLLVQKGADVNYAAKHNITPLHVAAKWGKSNMVTVLLEQGATIDAKTRDGLTPLHCAARSGHEQVVDMLLEKGAPISSKTKNGLAPLHMAAQGDHVDAARILLYHRAPVDEVTVDYLTALHVAAHCGHVKVAKLLLDRQADANARALNGFTPLHIACKKNRIKVVELLLKHGASIGATTESGLTPLHVASFMGCMNIVIYLLQHDASPDAPTVRGETPLHLAARANQTDIIRILLRNGAQVDARAREQQTPLHIASRLGNVDIVMLLLQHGAKVDTTTKDLYTALHIAAKEGQEDVATALIENGASVTATTKKGFTPLHLAAKYGHLKVAKLLLQKEAPVDAQGKNGVTPLHVASHYDHQNVALLLLEKGASPYATAKNGYTPLHIAAKKNQMDIANTLLEYGAKPNAESKAGFTPLHLTGQEGHCELSELLIEHKAEPNYNSKNGLTPLHLCAQDDRVPVAEVLVKNGAKVDAETKNGYTPLHIAAHYGQANMVRFLLKHGADVHAKTGLGYSPLHHAAQQGHTGIVNLLLENGAQPNVRTNSGQTPLDIAQKLGYITVIDTLKVITEEPTSPQLGSDEKYRVVAPEAMQETFMSDSEEEGGEDTVLAGDQTYRYLTADEMKSLGDDSLPIDVTRDERIDSNKFVNNENSLPPRHIEDAISPEHIHQNYVEYIKKYTPDNIEINRHPINIGFLVSFLVDARGGAMRGCRHSGVRVIVPPRCASSPTRITCRYVRPQRTPHPPPLMEGEALASRVLELGPVGAKFLGPVIIEVPHFAALRGKEREIVILRSDNGETWKEHTIDATEEVLNEVLHDSFEVEDLNQLEDVSSGRITRIITQDFPQYFAVVSRIRQEVHAIGPEGGMVSSTVVPQVQAVFPQGALTKKIKVGLQVQPIDPELTVKLLGHGVAVSPVVTVEPRRRKFHKAITLSMPTPRAHSQGMINQYSGNAPTLRLLCSITGGTTRAQWEDVTGSTPLTFVNDCVSFTTTVSARFWLMDCRNVGDATKMATELYRDAIHVPFMAKFVVFAKRVDPLEARLRVFCMTDDKEDKTLEHQEHFTEVAKSRDVEVLENKPQYIEFAGNLVPITKSGEQLQFAFRAFRENRLPFSVRVKDQHAEAVCRALFMRESKQPKGEPPQQPICILNIVLPDDIVVDTISLTDSYTDSSRKLDSYDYYRPDPRLADVSNLLGDDWVRLASQLGLTASEINVIKSEYPESTAKQAQSMLRMWLSQSGNKAQTDTLELALRRIGREDIVPHCLNEPTISTKPKLPRIPSSEGLKEKYLAEEKVFEEEENNSEEEDFNKTVEERRQQIEQRLERAAPASMQRVEIVQEITNIKRQSLVENKIAVVESARRDSELLEGVTEAIRRTSVPKIQPKDDLKSPKVMKTPPPSPADFILKEQRATIPEWDVSRKSTTGGEEPSASIDVDAEQQDSARLIQEEPKPQPKPRFAKEFDKPKPEKQISPVRDDLLDEDVPEISYVDKKKFWENRLSLQETDTKEEVVAKKRSSVHEVPVPKPRGATSTIAETLKEEDSKIMSEYQAKFQPPFVKQPSKEASSDSETESDRQKSSINDGGGYISDSGDVEHYISDSEIEDRVPQIRERQMSVFAPPVAAARKTIYERSASLPTEDLYEVSARSSKLRKQYYEEQIKKEMIEEQLTSEIEEVPSPERKNLILHKFESQTSRESSSSDQDKVQTSKIDSMEVLVDKSEIEDSEKLELEQDGTDIETKSLDSSNATDLKAEEPIPEITVTLSGLQRRISEESDEYAPKTNKAEEKVEATVWETPVQVQAFEKIDDELSIGAKDESETGSEIQQDHSSSLSEKIKSESQSDIERIILDSLHHQKVDPDEAKTIASQLISEIETEIQNREAAPAGSTTDYIKYLAETKGLDEREVQLVESVLARRERELAKLSRCDTSSIEITDEDLRYSGTDFDHTHLLEQQISQLKAEKVDDFERKEYETCKDYESTIDGITTSVKTDQYMRTEDSMRMEKSEKSETIVEEDETTSESSSHQKEITTNQIVGSGTHSEVSADKQEYREGHVDITKEHSSDKTEKTAVTSNEKSDITKTEKEATVEDVTKSGMQYQVETKIPGVEMKGTISTDDYSKKEESTKSSSFSEVTKLPQGDILSKTESESKKVTSTVHQEAVNETTEEKSADSCKIVKSSVNEVRSNVHDEITRTSSSESSGKSPDDLYSTCSSGRKGDSDTSKVVPLRKRTTIPKGDRKSGLEFEYSSSGESHYHSFELDSGKSRPCSSDIEGLVPAGSSEYESALTSQSHTEYHTAVSSLSSKESMKSLDSESSGHLGSVEVSELSETLVPSTSDLDDDENAWDDGATESKMKRSYEMTFQPEPKILTTESPQVEEPSMSVSSTTEPRTVIELSRTDSERMSGSNISDQLSIEGSCDSLVFRSDTSTTTGQIEGTTKIESISITTSTGSDQTRNVNTQVISEPEVKRKGHRRQESTSYIPTHSELTESDKYYATELSLKEVSSDERKDVDESYETEADQGFYRAMREEKYHSPDRKKSTSTSKSGSTSSSFEEAEAEAAFNMVAHVSPAHKISQICPILEDEDAEKHELETRERAQKEFERRRALLRDQSPGSIPDIKVTQHMTPLVDRNFHYPDLELEEAERQAKEKEQEKEEATAQTPSSKSSEETDQGREYVLEDSGISIPEEPTESQSTVLEKTTREEKDTTESENSDSFEMLEKPDLIDDFVVIEEVAREAHEFDSEGQSVKIGAKPKTKKKHDEEIEAFISKSEPTPPKTKMTELKYFPDTTTGGEELAFDFEDSPPIQSTTESGSNYDKELEANKQWIEQQFQGDQAARIAAGYDYEMEFERGPLEDIKEEDINDFDPTSSRIGSVGSQKESGGSLGSVKDSYSSTPDYDVLAGRKYFTRSGEHDDVSMSSLQEFENIEKAMSLEAKRAQQGSQDSSSNGSFKTRYYQSKAQGDDVSVSSLKEFEGLEQAIQAAHKVEIKAREEEAILSQIDEGQESQASESEETVKKVVPDSDEEDYEKRLFEIDEIIKQAQTNVERFIDLKEGEKTESLGRGDSVEEVAKVPDLDLDTPLAKSSVKAQWKDPDDCMATSVDSIEAMRVKHDSSADSLDQKVIPDVMTASTDSIEFERSKKQPINLLSDSIELKDEACGGGIVSSDSLELPRAEMLESTDSLVDPTSSTATTHATYQYETDSMFSGSMTSGGSNTMVSSTDTMEPGAQVDLAAAVRKVYFDDSTAGGYTTELLPDAGKPYVTEVIEPADDDLYSHTIHRRVELPPEVRKVTFYGSDADERLKQFIEDFGEGENVEEFEEVDVDGNVHTKRVVQKRYIVSPLANQTNQGKGEGTSSGQSQQQQAQESTLKAQATRRRPLRYDISLDDQIEVDPREHDWRFNLPEHAEDEEQSNSQRGQRPVSDQHQLSDEMKQLLQELERESKQ